MVEKTGIPVTGSTNALAKEEKGVYTYVIVIGSPPTKRRMRNQPLLRATPNLQSLQPCLGGIRRSCPGIGRYY